jgi:hypothetical protein
LSGTSGSDNFKFSTTVGDSLSGTLCNEGSTLLVTVHTGTQVGYFRCWRRTSNHNVCQRILP